MKPLSQLCLSILLEPPADSWEVDQIEAEDGKYPDTHLLETSWPIDQSLNAIKHPDRNLKQLKNILQRMIILATATIGNGSVFFLLSGYPCQKKFNSFWLGSRANLGYRKGGSFAREPNDKKSLKCRHLLS